MAVGKIVEGDTVILRGEVTRVSDDGRDITVRVRGYGIPLTVNRNHVQSVEKIPVTRRRRVFDQPGYVSWFHPMDRRSSLLQPYATFGEQTSNTAWTVSLTSCGFYVRDGCGVCHRRAPKLNDRGQANPGAWT